MGSISGKDMVDMMAEGVETYVKQHLLESIVENLVSEFKKDITKVVSDKLAEMAFRAKSENNHMEQRKDLFVLIEWVKCQKEYKTKYTMQSEAITDS